MEKVIYENDSSKLIANASDGVVELTQFFDGEKIGAASMYYEEVKELNEFIIEVNKDEQ